MYHIQVYNFYYSLVLHPAARLRRMWMENIRTSPEKPDSENISQRLEGKHRRLLRLAPLYLFPLLNPERFLKHFSSAWLIIGATRNSAEEKLRKVKPKNERKIEFEKRRRRLRVELDCATFSVSREMKEKRRIPFVVFTFFRPETEAKRRKARKFSCDAFSRSRFIFLSFPHVFFVFCLLAFPAAVCCATSRETAWQAPVECEFELIWREKCFN